MIKRIRAKVFRQKIQRGLWVGGVVALLLSLIAVANLFTSTRLRLNNIYFVNQDDSDKIVIIALDNDSLNTYGRSPVEWDRQLYARLVEILNQGEAKVVAFDILFAEETPQDEIFIDALINARRGKYNDEGRRTRFVMPVVGINPVENTTDFPSLVFSQTLKTRPEIAEVVDHVGYVNTIPDVDGAIRRIPSFVTVSEERGLSFSVAILMAHSAISSEIALQAIETDKDSIRITPNLNPNRRLYVDENGLWRHQYYGQAEETFPVYSMQAVLNGEVDPLVFKDKVVLVGLYNATGLVDQYTVPLGLDGDTMAGVEIQANAVETLLPAQIRTIREQNLSSSVLMSVGLALLTSLIYIQLRWYWMLVLTVGATIGFILVAFLIFDSTLIVVNLLYGILAIVLPGIVTLGVDVSIEATQRRLAVQQKNLLQAIQDGVPNGILLLNNQLIIQQGNLGASQNFNKQIEDFIGNPLQDLFAASELDDDIQQKILMQLAQKRAFREEIRLNQKTFYLYAIPLKTDWILLLNDISSLAELSELKTRMIRIASHDLKNPLSVIFGYVELISYDDTLPAPFRKYIEQIRSASNNMKAIIEDILTLEQLRSGKKDFAEVDVASLGREVTQRHLGEAQQKGQTLIAEIPDAVSPIQGDYRLLFQALSNLVGNAIKYTPENGIIKTRVFMKDHRVVRFEVEDNGYGISAEAQKKLFTEFYRVRTKATAHIKGTGLGLSLVKSVIEDHGGVVGVNSIENEGSTFFVELPYEDKTHENSR